MTTIENSAAEREARYFDELTVIRNFEVDLLSGDRIAETTRQRFYNEEATFYAEALDGPVISPYSYHFDGRDFYNVDGSSFGQMLKNGVVAAAQNAQRDPRYGFEYRRALLDQERHARLVEFMHSSDKMLLVVSPFPEEAAAQYGADFIEKKTGYDTQRKIAFLRIYSKTEDGRLEEECCSIDNSSLTDINHWLEHLGLPSAHTSEELISRTIPISSEGQGVEETRTALVALYDQLLAAKHPNSIFRAGRKIEHANEEINTWEFVHQQETLLNLNIDLLEDIARARVTKKIPGRLQSFIDASATHMTNIPLQIRNILESLPEQPERLGADYVARQVRALITYSIGATLRRTYEAATVPTTTQNTSWGQLQDTLDAVTAMANDALLALERLIGCGGVFEAFNQLSVEELRALAMQVSPEIYSFNKIAHCVSCDPDAKKPPVPCGPCDICWRCDTQSTRL